MQPTKVDQNRKLREEPQSKTGKEDRSALRRKLVLRIKCKTQQHELADSGGWEREGRKCEKVISLFRSSVSRYYPEVKTHFKITAGMSLGVSGKDSAFPLQWV